MYKLITTGFIVFLMAACAAAPSVKPSAADGFTGDSVRLIGRFDLRDSGRAAFSWPGSAVEFRFYGSSATMGLASPVAMRFLVEVDGASSELWVSPGEADYPLASGLVTGEHKVRLTRLAESFSGVTALLSDPLTDGQLLPPPAAPAHRLLVLGDSITAGYGVEGEQASCGYSQATSSPLLAYAGLAARELKADVHTIAWSGIGVWRSYGEQTATSPTIIERRGLTLGDDFNSGWDVSRYRPDAIVVAIGTNDFWQGSATGYRAAMAQLVAQLQTDYPERPLYLMLSPMLSGEARAAQRADLQAIASDDVKVMDLGQITADDGYGCDYHPNQVTQKRMAEALVQKLKNDLGW